LFGLIYPRADDCNSFKGNDFTKDPATFNLASAMPDKRGHSSEKGISLRASVASFSNLKAAGNKWRLYFRGFFSRSIKKWFLRIMLIVSLASRAGLARGMGNFGFTIVGTNNEVVVVEASNSLTNAAWSPIKAIALTGGSSYFSDSKSTNYSARFYRTRTLANSNSLWKVPPFGVEPFFWKDTALVEEDYWNLAQVISTNGFNKIAPYYIDITDGWQGLRDANGNLQPTSAFPHGIPFTVNVLHTNNVLAMIYTEPNPVTAAGHTGSAGYIWQDASNFVRWGIDAVRLDNSAQVPGTPGRNQRYVDGLLQMGAALEYYAGHPVPVGGNGWDTNQAVISTSFVNYFQICGLGDLGSGFDSNPSTGYWSSLFGLLNLTEPYLAQSGPGHFASIDFLPCNLGYGYAVLYALLSTPRFVSYPYTFAQDPAAYAVMTNEYLLKVNLDPLGIPGRIVLSNSVGQVWVKPLHDGSKFVALLNPSTNANATIGFSSTDIGYRTGTRMDLFDPWFQTNAQAVTVNTSTVPFLTNMCFIVTPSSGLTVEQ
jgi:alpha-galactosidase